MSPAVMVEPAMIKIGGVVSVKERAIVFKINPVAVVTIPDRVIIISIPGKVGFAYCGGGIIATCIDNRCRNGGSYINPGGWNTEPNTGANEYLSVTFRSYKAGDYNGGEDK
jgi:hypothetical protein